MKFLAQVFFFLFPLLASAAPGDRLEFAYRDAASADGRRVVILQGMRDRSFQFASFCGTAGEKCECLLYRAAGDPAPLRSAGASMSVPSNTFACNIPGDASTPDQIQLAAVRIRKAQLITEAQRIKTSLRLEEVLGLHAKDKVRGIFRHSCERTFFEGEGAQIDGSMQCPPSQRLGALLAKYNFYTYKSASDSNAPGGDVAYPSPICGRTDFLRVKCTGSTPSLRYGLYKEPTDLFPTLVSLRRAPQEGTATPYGYAAKPERNGLCPPGLVRIHTWVAQPASIVQGTLDPIAPSPPSTFVNINNALNDSLLELAQPSSFLVLRQANQTRCHGVTGDCSRATFGGRATAISAEYANYPTKLCVLPPNLLGGIF